MRASQLALNLNYGIIFSKRSAVLSKIILPNINQQLMLRWTITFLIIAIIAAVFGFGGIAAGAASIAKILFVIFLVLFVISLIFGKRAGSSNI